MLTLGANPGQRLRELRSAVDRRQLAQLLERVNAARGGRLLTEEGS
jgi:hypothetical protein